MSRPVYREVDAKGFVEIPEASEEGGGGMEGMRRNRNQRGGVCWTSR